MTQVSPAPSISGTPALRQIPSGTGGNAAFSLVPGGREPPRVTVRAPAPEVAEADDRARQAVAGTGKDLPGKKDVPVQDELNRSKGDESEDEADPSADPAFAWFAMALPTEAAPAPVAADPASVTLPEGEAASLPEGMIELPAEMAASTEPLPAELAKAMEALEGVAPTPAEISTETPARRIAGLDITRLGRIELPAHSPVAQTLAALQPRTEGNSFTATLAAMGVTLPEPLRPNAPHEANVAMLTPLNGLEMQRVGVVQAVSDVQQAMIDTRRSDWMTATIERIEALRDSPNARETSLRLSPDALGKIDVSIRQEGDKIHVRFSAETAAARTLLTEAQSRLNDIAEARGLKLGGSSVDSGNAGQGHSQRHEAASSPAIASAPLRMPGGETETTTEPNTSGRVA